MNYSILESADYDTAATVSTSKDYSFGHARSKTEILLNLINTGEGGVRTPPPPPS